MTLTVRRGPADAAVRTSVRPLAIGLLLAVLGVVLAVVARPGTTTYTFTEPDALIALPGITVPAAALNVVVAVMLVGFVAIQAWNRSLRRRDPVWMTPVAVVAFTVSFLTWGAAGASVPVTTLLSGAVLVSVPLIFGAMGGIVSERSGVINVSIEGQLLSGAFCSAVVATVTGSAVAGLVAAVVGGALVASILALFSLRFLADQVVVGIVLNVLVAGLTGYFYSQVLSPNPTAFNLPERLPKITIPGLSEIPVIGPVLFDQSVIVYAMYALLAVLTFALYRTRWGLRVRAVGEHPTAAATVGISVRRTRLVAVLTSGAIAGFGGAFFTLGSVGAFGKEMTSGAGFIALAAVILGRWDPVRALLAALLFGFTMNLRNILGVIGAPIPVEFILMLPYVVTILAVAGFVGRSIPPAANGRPYSGR